MGLALQAVARVSLRQAELASKLDSSLAAAAARRSALLQEEQERLAALHAAAAATRRAEESNAELAEKLQALELRMKQVHNPWQLCLPVTRSLSCTRGVQQLAQPVRCGATLAAGLMLYECRPPQSETGSWQPRQPGRESK